MVTQSQLDGIPGWFHQQDIALFRAFLAFQDQEEMRGDLAELGAYKGKSAVLIGSYLRSDECFTVVDLFEDHGDTDGDNSKENHDQYVGLQMQDFEANYRRVHGALPQVVRGPSERVVDVARHGNHRFVHVDASHLYDHVRGDLKSARLLLAEPGVVVLDDYRSAHTPGVAAAVWEEVTTGGLIPLIVSPVKMYATWGDPDPWLRMLRDWLPTSGLSFEEQRVQGHSILRAWSSSAGRAARWVPPVAVGPLLRVRSRLTQLTR